MKKIYVIHENDEWTIHLEKRLQQLELPYELWHLAKGHFDLTSPPPEGVFYSRMSASAHTRDHRFAPEYAQMILGWLEHYERKVFNGQAALKLELSKVHQYLVLSKAGIRTPKTIAANGKADIIEAAKKLGAESFITKHNRAGKGLGVQLFHSIEALESYVNSAAFEEPVDGITLIQQYIKSPESFITRAEFIGGKFFYAVQVDTTNGFELCPADVCQISDLMCPVGEQPADIRPKFRVIDEEEIDSMQIAQYEKFLAENGIAVAGIEFISDADGTVYTYDINTNTNYNSDAEALAERFAMLELATFLDTELNKL